MNWHRYRAALRWPGKISASLVHLPAMKSVLAGFLAMASVSHWLPAHALTYMQTLDFVAPDQSIWGSGGTAGFNYSDSVSFSIPLGLGSASVGYSVGANSGTVSAGFYGNMSADYTPSLSAPGTTSISLSYQGQDRTINLPPLCLPFVGCIPTGTVPVLGGQLTSTLGAHAQLTSSLGNVGPDFTLDINESFNSQLDQTVSGSDSVPDVVQVPVVDILIGSAGVQMGVTQTNSFTATGIEGFLYYSREGSGITSSMPFLLPTDSGVNLSFDLLDPGTWSFWFVDQTLENTFSTSLDLDLGLFYETFAGCGFLGTSSCSGSTNLLSVTAYDGNPFALDFNNITNLNGFSIEVSAIPVPAAIWLFGSGLIGLIGIARSKKA